MANRKYDMAHIRKYVAGELSPKEMSELERAAHADEMLMDLILGMETAKQQQSLYPEDDITARINARAAVKKERPIVLWKKFAIAASLLAIVSASIYFFRTNLNDNKTLEIVDKKAPDSSTEETVESRLSFVDSAAKADSAIDTKLAYNAAPSRSPSRKQHQLPAVQNTQDIDRQEENKDDVTVELRSENQQTARAKTSVPIQNTGRARSAGAENQADSSSKNWIVVRGISIAQPTNKKTTVVSGQVIDSLTNQPLPHAVIKDLASNNVTSANEKGIFVLSSDIDSVNLDIQYLGYKSQRIAANTSAATLNIKLRPDENMLEEIVVSEYDRVNSPNKSVPTIGWKAYKAYIDTQATAKDLSKGTVTLQFDLNEAGCPENIRVEKSVDSLHDQAAIDIVKNGPPWRLGKKSTGLKVKVKFKK